MAIRFNLSLYLNTSASNGDGQTFAVLVTPNFVTLRICINYLSFSLIRFMWFWLVKCQVRLLYVCTVLETQLSFCFLGLLPRRGAIKCTTTTAVWRRLKVLGFWLY